MAKPGTKPARESKDKGGAIAVDEKPSRPSAPPRFQLRYKNEVRPALKAKFGIKNDHAIPKIEKVVINMGLGKAAENKNRVEHALRDLTAIAGQKPVIAKARKSIAGFKLRQGMPIGLMVTLRRERMWEFLDRLISIVIPRIRDFRGLPKKLDGRGSYSMGINEQGVFPEVNLDKLEFVQGMQITIVTSSDNDEKAIELLELLGMPFRRPEDKDK